MGPDAEPTFSSLTLSGLTASSLIYPTSTGLLTSLGAATNGQIPIGSTGADPVLAEITGTANQVTVTSGAGSITLSTPQDIHTEAPSFTVNGAVAETVTLVEVDALPPTAIEGQLIKLGTDNRLYYGLGDYEEPGDIVTGNPMPWLFYFTYTV